MTTPSTRLWALLAALAVLATVSTLALRGTGSSPEPDRADAPPAPVDPPVRPGRELAAAPPPAAAPRTASGQQEPGAPGLAVTGHADLFPCALAFLDGSGACLEMLRVDAPGTVPAATHAADRAASTLAITHLGHVFPVALDASRRAIALGGARWIACTLESDADLAGEPEPEPSTRELTQEQLTEEMSALVQELADLGYELDEDTVTEALRTRTVPGTDQTYFELAEEMARAFGEEVPERVPQEDELLVTEPEWPIGRLARLEDMPASKAPLQVACVFRDERYLDRIAGPPLEPEEAGPEQERIALHGLVPDAAARLVARAHGTLLAETFVGDGAARPPDDTRLELDERDDSRLWVEWMDPRADASGRLRVRPVDGDEPRGTFVGETPVELAGVLPGLWAVDTELADGTFGTEVFAIAGDSPRELLVPRGLESTTIDLDRRESWDAGVAIRVYHYAVGIDVPIPCGRPLERDGVTYAVEQVPRGMAHVSARFGDGGYQGQRVECDEISGQSMPIVPDRELAVVPLALLGPPTQALWLCVLDEQRTPIEHLPLAEAGPVVGLPLLDAGTTHLELFDRLGRSLGWFEVDEETARPLAYVAGSWITGESAQVVLDLL